MSLCPFVLGLGVPTRFCETKNFLKLVVTLCFLRGTDKTVLHWVVTSNVFFFVGPEFWCLPLKVPDSE